jgi:hypothetical protein
MDESRQRKTPELLCSAQNVSGANLKDKTKARGSQGVMPPDLLSGLEGLRLLGNDAAHIQEGIEVAIGFAREVLKAVYPYAALLARLRGLTRLSQLRG